MRKSYILHAWVTCSISKTCYEKSALNPPNAVTYCREFFTLIKPHTLKIQVVGPVEQINEDEGERKGQSWVVVNIVWVFHMATVQEAQNATQEWQGLDTATLGLLFFSDTGSGTAGAASTGKHLLPFAHPQSLPANGCDNPIHLILTFLHLLSILATNKETWKSSVDTAGSLSTGQWRNLCNYASVHHYSRFE